MKKIVGVILGIVGTLFVGFGVCFIPKRSATSISVIGGADGPTSIFLAGKVGSGSAIVVIGLVLVAAGIIFAVKKGKRNR